MSCGVGHRHGSDPALLWLWRRLAAVTLIRSLAWEPPYAVGAALKKKSLCILEVNPSLVASFAKIFSHSVVCLFLLFIVSCAVQKFVSLIRSHLFIFVLFSLL